MAAPDAYVDPFRSVADPEEYVPRAASERVLDGLWAALELDTGPALALVGPPGIGKSTVARVLMARTSGRRTSVYVPTGAAPLEDLLDLTLDALGDGPAEDPVGALQIRASLLERRGRPLLWIIDGADGLDTETLSGLADLWTGASGAISLLLLATEREGLDARLEAFGPQLQRVSFSEPMTLAETRDYVDARMERAAASSGLRTRLDDPAVARVHVASGGVPGSLHAAISEIQLEAWRAGDAGTPPADDAGTPPADDAGQPARQQAAARPRLFQPQREPDARAVPAGEPVEEPEEPARVAAQAGDEAAAIEPAALDESAAIGDAPDPIEAPGAIDEPAAAVAPAPAAASPIAPAEVLAAPPAAVETPAAKEPLPEATATDDDASPDPSASAARSWGRSVRAAAPAFAAGAVVGALLMRGATQLLLPPPAPPAAVAASPARELPDVAAVPVPPGERVRLSVQAFPWAVIWIDGKRVGETPLAEVRVTRGFHDFRAELPDGRSLERRVEVREDGQRLVFR